MGAGTCPARGWQTQLWVQDAGESDVWDEELYCQTVTLAKQVQSLDMAGLRGSVQHHSNQYAEGTYEVTGQITKYLTMFDWNIWAPRVLADSGGSTPFTPAGTLPAFDLLANRVSSDGTGTKFDFQDCVVAKATFAAKAREPIMATYDIQGLSRGALVTTSPSAVSRGTGTEYRPLLFQNSTLTYDGNSVPMNDFSLVIDNVIEADWQNSQTATSLCMTDQRITLTCTLPWTAAVAADHFETNGAAGVLTWTGTNISAAWTFADMRKVNETDPVTNARGKMTYTMTLEAYQSGDVGSLVDSVSCAVDANSAS